MASTQTPRRTAAESAWATAQAARRFISRSTAERALVSSNAKGALEQLETNSITRTKELIQLGKLKTGNLLMRRGFEECEKVRKS